MECTQILYRGFVKKRLAKKRIMSLTHLGPPPLGLAHTCEALELVMDLLWGEFDQAGCSWGYPKEVFEAR